MKFSTTMITILSFALILNLQATTSCSSPDRSITYYENDETMVLFLLPCSSEISTLTMLEQQEEVEQGGLVILKDEANTNNNIEEQANTLIGKPIFVALLAMGFLTLIAVTLIVIGFAILFFIVMLTIGLVVFTYRHLIITILGIAVAVGLINMAFQTWRRHRIRTTRKINAASRTIRRYWSQHSAAIIKGMKLIRANRDRKCLAAAKKRIQAIFRLQKWSRQCLAANTKRLQAIVQLQNWTRQRLHYLKNKRNRLLQIQKQHVAASRIQWAVRRFMARVSFRESAAAITIRRIVLGHMTRVSYTRKLYQIRLIQAQVRQWLLSHQQEDASCRARLKLQSWTRMCLARNVLSSLVSTKRIQRIWLESRTAATLIQSAVRLYQTKKQQLQRQSAARIIQTAWRCYDEQQCWSLWKKYCSAATSIQSIFRGFLAKRERDQEICFNSIADAYIRGDKIGDGSFGIVFRATCRETNRVVAVKEVDTTGNDAFTDHSRRFLNREIEIMVSLRDCPNIVQLVDVFQGPYKTFMVMEECNGGNIQHQLDMKGSFEERQARDILGSVFNAVNYMHQRGMAHCDIKPENVLLANQGSGTTVKLADFGLTQMVTTENSLHARCGTAHYMAPEVWMAPFEGFPGYDERADMWSIGVMAYQLLGGNMPFSVNQIDAHLLSETDYNNKLRVAVCCVELDFPDDDVWNKISGDAKSMICNLLKKNPMVRYSAENALNCNWLICGEDELPVMDLSGPHALGKVQNPVMQQTVVASSGIGASLPSFCRSMEVSFTQQEMYGDVSLLEAISYDETENCMAPEDPFAGLYPWLFEQNVLLTPKASSIW